MKKLLALTMIGVLSAMLSVASYAITPELFAFELTPYVLDLAPEPVIDTDADYKYFLAHTDTPEARRALQRLSKSVSATSTDHRYMHRLNYKRQWQPQLS